MRENPVPRSTRESVAVVIWSVQRLAKTIGMYRTCRFLAKVRAKVHPAVHRLHIVYFHKKLSMRDALGVLPIIDVDPNLDIVAFGKPLQQEHTFVSVLHDMSERLRRNFHWPFGVCKAQYVRFVGVLVQILAEVAVGGGQEVPSARRVQLRPHNACTGRIHRPLDFFLKLKRRPVWKHFGNIQQYRREILKITVSRHFVRLLVRTTLRLVESHVIDMTKAVKEQYAVFGSRVIIIVYPESEDLLALLRRGYVLFVYAIFAVVVGNEPGAAEDGVERLVCCT